MKNLTHKIGRHLACVLLTTVVFLCLNGLNELAFLRFEQSNGVNWIFLPAGIRLLATLLFGLAGFEGLLLAGIYLNFHHFEFHSDFRAWSGAFAGAAGPYVASLFARHWFFLKPRLEGLTVPRLLFTGVLCGMMSPIFHHALMWVLTGLMDWTALLAMIVGDIVGILIVLTIVKGLVALAGRRDPAGDRLRRCMSRLGWKGANGDISR
ncbi:hypothetical protein AB595_11850 [Massilia sp. WF1]|uniref:hypothetical protein n=1 Tax=unclassified Massilia TaxID=2609279 RepID=UPI00064A07B5|nr:MULTISPECIES: hypothetical protein [unclassified Massilia]ALK97303.1 hypothetical protein AM586_14730 [Massilia sp. WG5]KLU36484.1 hypothetical protein AB595_11850 [Massilia sp. WF1]